MDSLIHADIFFFLSSILLTAATLVFIIAIFYLLRILKDVRAIAALARSEAEKLSGDLEVIREKFRNGRALAPAGILGILSGIWKKRRNRKGRS